jgi:hypothetical protein
MAICKVVYETIAPVRREEREMHTSAIVIMFQDVPVVFSRNQSFIRVLHIAPTMCPADLPDMVQ